MKAQPRQARDKGGSSPKRSPNDDRAIVKNPNNPAHAADAANQAAQRGGDIPKNS